MPGIFLGSTPISPQNILLPATEFKEVYVGDVKVWPTGPSVEVTQTVTELQTNVVTSTATVNIGPAFTGRQVVIYIGRSYGYGTGRITAVSINGVAAQQLSTPTSNSWFAFALASSKVETGTTCTLSVTWSRVDNGVVPTFCAFVVKGLPESAAGGVWNQYNTAASISVPQNSWEGGASFIGTIIGNSGTRPPSLWTFSSAWGDPVDPLYSYSYANDSAIGICFPTSQQIGPALTANRITSSNYGGACVLTLR